jgi:hypothetical protein
MSFETNDLMDDGGIPEPNPFTYYTDRGFLMFDDFRTDYGHRMEVQESSAAEEPCVWVRIRSSDMDRATSSLTASATAHLTVGHAARLRDALDRFVTSTEGGQRFPTDRP